MGVSRRCQRQRRAAGEAASREAGSLGAYQGGGSPPQVVAVILVVPHQGDDNGWFRMLQTIREADLKSTACLVVSYADGCLPRTESGANLSSLTEVCAGKNISIVQFSEWSFDEHPAEMMGSREAISVLFYALRWRERPPVVGTLPSASGTVTCAGLCSSEAVERRHQPDGLLLHRVLGAALRGGCPRPGNVRILPVLVGPARDDPV